jgi:hypothetical protein
LLTIKTDFLPEKTVKALSTIIGASMLVFEVLRNGVLKKWRNEKLRVAGKWRVTRRAG